VIWRDNNSPNKNPKFQRNLIDDGEGKSERGFKDVFIIFILRV